jgi:hypothetical protein
LTRRPVVITGVEQATHHALGFGGGDGKTTLHQFRRQHSRPCGDGRGFGRCDAPDTTYRDVRTQGVHRAFGDHTALGNHADAISQCFGFFEVVRGEDDGATLGHGLANCRPERLASDNVHPDRRFVEEEDFRSTRQRHGELHAALLAAGQTGVAASQEIGDPSQTRAIGDRSGRRVITGRETDQLTHLQGRWQGGRLQHHPDAPACLDVLRIAPEQADAAAVRPVQTEEQADTGALTGAVGPQQREQFAAVDLQVNSVQRDDGAVALADLVQTRNAGVVVHGVLPCVATYSVATPWRQSLASLCGCDKRHPGVTRPKSA